MKRASILSILGVAVATMAVTLAILAPEPVGADSEGLRISPQIAQPELTVDGCRFTVATDKGDYAPGEKPRLRATASNPTNRRVQTTVTLQILSAGPSSPLSRVVQLPTPIWTDRWVVDLGPGQSVTKDFESSAGLPDGKLATVMMASGDVALIASQLNMRGEVELLQSRPASLRGNAVPQ